MKYPILILLMLVPGIVFSQVASSDPEFPVDTDEVTVRFDVSNGSGSLSGYDGDVYVHAGVITDASSSSTDWKYVLTGWGENSPETKLTRISADIYEIVISPNIRDYYNVPETEKITHLAFVLRSGAEVSGSYLECKEADGKDIYVEVYEPGLQVSIIDPSKNLLLEKNTEISFIANVSASSDLKLFMNNELVKTVTGIEITHNFSFAESGDYWLKVEANNGDETDSDSVFVHVLADEITESIPDGMIEGFNETSSTSGILVLYAPGKDNVFVLGDFNLFTPSGDYRLKKDGEKFWIELSNLNPAEEYAYQYLVDGELKIADPYAEKVLDPWNDKWIEEDTYPGLKKYPDTFTEGIVSVLQTNKTQYEWSEIDFQSPDQDNLIIYELLLRDFIEAHDWKTLTDTLNYFTTLGINAIELMPFNEFEGNESWGYNPSFYFAPDKYYGPANDLKEFIDSCHNRGIAVIMDVVYNHSFGQSPLVQLYWNSTLSRPSADNPWYNETSPNTAYSWGYDFNHEAQATKDFIDRANTYWLTEYKLDGFRFDFTKGFTNTAGDGGAYDAARISILKRMADAIWNVKSDAYVILEHFAPNSEEKDLADYGMMIWGNHNYNYNEATMGWNEDAKSDFSWISYQNRSWNDPHLVGYMESHDEERLMYKNLQYGNSTSVYDITHLGTALHRVELAACFFIPVPGPKMIWQFGEMGYAFSIDYNGRVGNKPIRWDYYDSRPRIREVFGELNKLKLNEPAFRTEDFDLDFSSAGKRISLNHTDMDVRIIGNFDVTELNVAPEFSKTGNWYEYFSGEVLDVSDVNMTIELQPGEYRIYTTKQFDTPSLPTKIIEYPDNISGLKIFPNPVKDILFIRGDHQISEVEIIDLGGRVLKKESDLGNIAEMSLSFLEKGLYFVKISDVNGNIQAEQIMKY